MGVAALRIRLPYLDHGIVDRHPIAVEHSLDANFVPETSDVRRSCARGVLPVVDIARLPIATAVRRQTISEERADRL